MCTAVLATTPADLDPDQALEAWEGRLGHRLDNAESVIAASRSAHDLVNLGVAARQIRILAMLSTHPAEA